ncbi:MAG: type III-A CRISPR-associated RAMP protein Csm3 [Deltaproteobacteria bacterium]|nr:MAG: type III-A CRISPR-associated RAMP protein Csm3 [Deltaproteobacteria bacterium]RLB02037.1 MAG: type III-A CRISPR-associated RAMP protein Csm3 [Deltaproteobacteria bacterium]
MSGENKDKILKLEKKVFIEGEIIAKTGLHIGGSSTGLTIGGADKVVVRNPVTNLPYIPGSSLKGKMRSLLEKSLGLVKVTKENEEWVGKLCKDPNEDVVQLFGFPADEGVYSEDTAPTRLIVRDCELLNKDELEDLENTDMYCTEIKTEVSIDRLTAKANPRNFERVPAGARFSLNLVVDIYDVDIRRGDEGLIKENTSTEGSEKKKGNETRADSFMTLVSQALKLVEDDYLGGQGTRGYGRVKFKIKSVKEKTAQDYLEDREPKDSETYKEHFKAFMNGSN